MKNLICSFGLACVVLFTGCLKPYHEATLVDIQTSEIAILVPTVGSDGAAVTAPSEQAEGNVEFYKNKIVNARKVEIPYYWKQTHRVWFYDSAGTGKWVPAARLITVNTEPETRTWDATSDHGIWVESKDSVGFSTGVSVSARIENVDDAVKFLSHYPPKAQRVIETAGGDPFNVEITGLKQIMDLEVRTKIQEVFAYEAASYNMDELREKKQEIMDKVREMVIPFFSERGITITNIGQFGGFKYENPETQLAIDKVFQAQQDEEVAKAEAKAAQERMLALQLKGQGEAQQAIEIARGRAEAMRLEAQAEAEAVQLVADAKAYELTQLSSNPQAYILLKQIELEVQRVTRWDGAYPRFVMGQNDGLNGQGMLLNLNLENAE